MTDKSRDYGTNFHFHLKNNICKLIGITKYVKWKYFFNQIIVVDKFSNSQLNWEARQDKCMFDEKLFTNIDHATKQKVAYYVMANKLARTLRIQETVDKDWN